MLHINYTESNIASVIESRFDADIELKSDIWHLIGPEIWAIVALYQPRDRFDVQCLSTAQRNDEAIVLFRMICVDPRLSPQSGHRI